MAMLSKRKLDLSFDTSKYEAPAISEFYQSGLSDRKTSFPADPVRKGKLDVSSAPEKRFGNYVRNNPADRNAGVEDRREGSEYRARIDKKWNDYTRDSIQTFNNEENTKEGRGRGRENMDINSPQQNNSEWFRQIDEGDSGPAGLKSNQSRKASPEEAIDKTFNRR